MRESEAWRIQAESDLKVGQRTFDKEDISTYCHTIAKYQQSVEKNVKGVAALLSEFGAMRSDSRPRDRGHGLERSFKQLRILVTSASSRQVGIDGISRSMLEDYYVSEANFVCGLAPSYPEGGDLFPRNTEYPFNTDDAGWTAPCADGAYSIDDTRRCLRAAEHFDDANARFFKVLSVSKKKA